MKTQFVISLVAFTIFCPCVEANAGSTARNELNQVYKTVNAAAAQGNSEMIYRRNSPDFRCGITKNQPKTAKIHGRYAMLHLWRAAYGNAQSLRINTSIQRFNLTSNRVTVVIKDHATFVHKDTTTQSTKSEGMITLAVETWVKNNKRWQLLRSYTLASKQLPSKTLT